MVNEVRGWACESERTTKSDHKTAGLEVKQLLNGVFMASTSQHQCPSFLFFWKPKENNRLHTSGEWNEKQTTKKENVE